jgi:hypothetical protein
MTALGLDTLLACLLGEAGQGQRGQSASGRQVGLGLRREG